MENNARVLAAIDNAIEALEELRATIADVPWQCECNKEKDKSYVVERTLIKLGIPTNCLGYRYLCHAIRLVFEREDYMKITGYLYPEIAKSFKSTPSKVERATRTAIKSSWGRADKDLQRKIFPDSENIATNGNYIFSVAEYLRMTI